MIDKPLQNTGNCGVRGARTLAVKVPLWHEPAAKGAI